MKKPSQKLAYIVLHYMDIWISYNTYWYDGIYKTCKNDHK